MKNTIIINNVKVIFCDLKDRGFGKSVTIAVDDKIKADITAWVKTNNINGGIPRFKEYTNKNTKETTTQYTFKFSNFIEIESPVSESEGYGLRYGAIISLRARAFEYNNKFGSGVSSSVSHLYVKEPVENFVMSELKK